MLVSTHTAKKESPKRDKEATTERLIAAAGEIFAAHGLAGATTREIAKAAGVSEMTLFRHFPTKEHLLSAVVHRLTETQTKTLEREETWTGALETDLLRFAGIYAEVLETHEALIRMFIGEAKRHPENAVRVLQRSALPLRDKLVAYLEAAVARGEVRNDLDLPMTVDMFTGMLLAEMLRRHIGKSQRQYGAENYLAACVALFIRGIRV